MLDDLRELVSRETPSNDLEALRSFAVFLRDYAASRIGADGEMLVRDGHSHVRFTGGDGDGRPVLLLGHLDTVWDSGTLSQMPFRVQDGKAYGPGTFDMKGGLVQGSGPCGRSRRRKVESPPSPFSARATRRSAVARLAR